MLKVSGKSNGSLVRTNLVMISISCLKIREAMVFGIRGVKRIDKIGAPQKTSLHYMRMRMRDYRRLCRLQTAAEQAGCKLEIKKCSCCGVKRFDSTDFFINNKCRVCDREINVLRRMGIKGEELKRRIARFFERLPYKTVEELEKLLKFHKQHKLVDNFVVCEHCRKKWPKSWQYFHQIIKDGKSELIDICLACPAFRRFFSR